MRVYLAGPIFGCSDDEAFGWREEATTALAAYAEVVSPMRRDFRGSEQGNEALIIEADKRDIRSVDAVLVNAQRPTWGTGMEIHYAHGKRKRIVAFVGKQRPSPWLTYHCEYVFPDLEDALTALLAGVR
jgi:nucleoside 2-deoxyribosyltransferase